MPPLASSGSFWSFSQERNDAAAAARIRKPVRVCSTNSSVDFTGPPGINRIRPDPGVPPIADFSRTDGLAPRGRSSHINWTTTEGHRDCRPFIVRVVDALFAPWCRGAGPGGSKGGEDGAHQAVALVRRGV